LRTGLHQITGLGWSKPNRVSLLYHSTRIPSCQELVHPLPATGASAQQSLLLPVFPSSLLAFPAVVPPPSSCCCLSSPPQLCGESSWGTKRSTSSLSCLNQVKHCRIKDLLPLDHTSINQGPREQEDELLLQRLVIAWSLLSAACLSLKLDAVSSSK